MIVYLENFHQIEWQVGNVDMGPAEGIEQTEETLADHRYKGGIGSFKNNFAFLQESREKHQS
jgi:hypothetical protein